MAGRVKIQTSKIGISELGDRWDVSHDYIIDLAIDCKLKLYASLLIITNDMNYHSVEYGDGYALIEDDIELTIKDLITLKKFGELKKLSGSVSLFGLGSTSYSIVEDEYIREVPLSWSAGDVPAIKIEDIYAERRQVTLLETQYENTIVHELSPKVEEKYLKIIMGLTGLLKEQMTVQYSQNRVVDMMLEKYSDIEAFPGDTSIKQVLSKANKFRS